MNLLLIGGGVFLGAAVVAAALARRHTLTVFNRGRARSTWPDGVQVLTGDRTTDLALLAGRRFDAVIDTCGFVPADVQAGAAALRDCGRYLFVSSISAYASLAQPGVTEDAPLAPFDTVGPDDRDLTHYGAQKAACEAVVQSAFGDRSLLVRPGLIVGPGDRSGRFDFWPWRVADGGTMLAPAAPADAPLQCVDVRDLAAWMLTLLERGESGAFNACGPVGDTLTWPQLLSACAEAVAARGGVPAEMVAVAESFLVAQGVEPWTGLPMWLPSTDPDHTGFNRVDVSRIAALGLPTRTVRETVDAVLAAGVPPRDDPRRTGKLSPAREAAVIAAWRAAGSAG